MYEALKEARKALEEGEIPVGAIIVREGRIIGRGHNKVERLKDPTAHAEMIAISDAAKNLGNWRLNDSTIYVTLEPCIMCCGALVLARINDIVYGMEDPKFGGAVSLFEIPEDPRLNHQARVRKGPCGEEARELIKTFFRKRRKGSFPNY